MANIYDMADTWNNVATTFTAIKMNVTDTASASASLLMDLQVGGTSQASITKAGAGTFATGLAQVSWSGNGNFTTRYFKAVDSSGGIFYFMPGGSNRIMAAHNSTVLGLQVANNCGYLFSSATTVAVGNTDLGLYRDAAYTLAQRYSTNAQTFNIYNTYTDASNYERLAITWSSNVAKIQAQQAGTGSARVLAIAGSNTTGNNVQIICNDGGAGFNKISFMNNTVEGMAYHPYAGGGTIPYFGLGSTVHILWDTSATATGGSGAVGLKRAATGVLAITNGHRATATQVGGAISTPTAGEKTIATGAITATGGYHTVDTESDAATDDLDTINGGNDGQFLVIQAADGARTVVAKDGTGNLQLNGDFSLDNAQDTLTLIYSAALSAWVEISRSDNGA